ncbi:extracellular matrix regulator RemB [Natranaerobius thermophilus]
MAEQFMFVHIGDNIVLPIKEIVGIFDISVLEDKATRDFLKISEEEGFVKNNKYDNRERSFVLTGQNIYFSPITSVTLKKRIEKIYNQQDGDLFEQEEEDEIDNT